MFISTHQALMLWAQLEDCYSGRNGYGSDTAEIYAYTVMPHSPSFAANPEKAINSPLIGECTKEMLLNAAASLVSVVNMFCKHRGCTAEIDGFTPNMWISQESGLFIHRCLIKIQKKEKK